MSVRTASFHLRKRAVQQFGRRCQTPGPGWTRKGTYPGLLGMRGRADGRVGSLRGTWRSFHLLRGMGRPTGRSMPGKKTSCGTGRPGGVQRNPCAKPSKMNGICLGLACSGTQGPPEASGVPEPARRVPQNRALKSANFSKCGFSLKTTLNYVTLVLPKPPKKHASLKIWPTARKRQKITKN